MKKKCCCVAYARLSCPGAPALRSRPRVFLVSRWTHISFCDIYNDGTTCFSTAKDADAEAMFLADGVSPSCSLFHKAFLCAAGDPYQAHLFGLESLDPPRTKPIFSDFCREYKTNCEADLGYIIDCPLLVGDAPYCLPVELMSGGTGA